MSVANFERFAPEQVELGGHEVETEQSIQLEQGRGEER